MKGCIVGLFKLIGGIIGAVVGLVFAMSLLSNEKSVTPGKQLEIRCEEGSKTQPPGAEQRAFYESCIASGSSVIRAQERINREGSQSYRSPSNVGVTEAGSSTVAPLSPRDTASQAPTSSTPSPTAETQPASTLSTPSQSPAEVLPTLSPLQSSQETAELNTTSKQPE